MTEFSYRLVELAIVVAIVSLAASAILVSAAASGMLLLPPFRAIQGLVGFLGRTFDQLFDLLVAPLRDARTRLGTWRSGQFEAVASEKFGSGDRAPHADARGVSDEQAPAPVGDALRPMDSDGTSPLMALLLPTIVFGTAIFATVMLVVASADLIGLDSWTGATGLLPWIIGVALITTTVYAWSRRSERLGRWSFGVGAVAVMLFALMRGVDIWIQEINTLNTDLELTNAAGDIPVAPRILQDFRALLPLPIYIAAELSIMLGAAVAYRGFRGLVHFAITVPVAALELALALVTLALNVINWIVNLVLGAIYRVIGVVVALSQGLLDWLRASRLGGRLPPKPGTPDVAEETPRPIRLPLAVAVGVAAGAATAEPEPGDDDAASTSVGPREEEQATDILEEDGDSEDGNIDGDDDEPPEDNQ